MARRPPKAYYFVVKVESHKGQTKVALTRDLREALADNFHHLGQRTTVKPIVLMPAPRPALTFTKEKA